MPWKRLKWTVTCFSFCVRGVALVAKDIDDPRSCDSGLGGLSRLLNSDSSFPAGALLILG